MAKEIKGVFFLSNFLPYESFYKMHFVSYLSQFEKKKKKFFQEIELNMRSFIVLLIVNVCLDIEHCCFLISRNELTMITKCP